MTRMTALCLAGLLLLAGCSDSRRGSRIAGLESSQEAPLGAIRQEEETSGGETEPGEYTLHVIDRDALPEREDEDIIEIREKLFIAQTNELYMNADDYLGKKVRYQGIYRAQQIEETGETLHYVIRYGPGCCGYDGNAGFEVAWNGDYPPDDSWVEATGFLEEYGENGWMFLRLWLTDITVKSERGQEYVTH